ncbi:MAG: FAD-dependent oxidoreductase, partial [Patescibacteria group bacterium]
MVKILILGGGFGGVRAALDLEKKLRSREDVKITLIDKSDCHVFTPALYEVASIYGVNHEHPYHTKLRGVISVAYNRIFNGKKVELMQAEINHIDINAKHVVTNSGTTINFDYLVLALGSKTSTFGTPGVEEYAYKFKTIEDGLMLSD